MRAPVSPSFVDLKYALQDGELSDEAVQQRHAQRAEANNQIDRGEIGHGCCQATELGNHARVTALVEHADSQEERASGDAVVNLLEDAAGEAVGRDGEKSQSVADEMT